MRRKAWVGIDPGVKGAMALLDETGFVDVLDWTGVEEMHIHLNFWTEMWGIELVYLESAPGRPHESRQSTTTFQQHIGMILIIDLVIQLFVKSFHT